MSYLIFCSFNVGGLLTSMAHGLRQQKVPVYLCDIAHQTGHDSGAYHYGYQRREYDVSPVLRDPKCDAEKIEYLRHIKKNYGIEHCFATGMGAYLLAEAGIAYNYWAYGSDLDHYASLLPYRFKGTESFWEQVREKIETRYWRVNFPNACKSITSCEKIFYAPHQHLAARRLVPEKQTFFIPHLLNPPSFEHIQALRLSLPPELHDRPYIISTTRHLWCGPNAMKSGNKGNDLAMSGFAAYLDKSGDNKTILLLIRKGDDWEATAAIAKNLGITERVVWLDPVPRPQLSRLYAGAWAALGQFGTPVLAGTSLEPLAHGVPSISHYLNQYPVETPVLNVRRDKDDIACALLKVNKNLSEHERMRRSCWEWARENCGEEAFARAFVKAFE